MLASAWSIIDRSVEGPAALAVGADGGGGLFGRFYSHLSFLFPFSLSLRGGPT